MKVDRAGSIMLLGVGMFLGVLLSFGLSVITAPSEEQVPAFEEICTLERDDLIRVFHDNKRNVTCWVWSIGTARGGISCIPNHLITP